MPQSASLFRGHHACFSGRKPARVAPHRLRAAVAAKDKSAGGAAEEPSPNSVLLGVESNTDGTLIFKFGAEQEALIASRTASASAAAATVAPPSPSMAAVVSQAGGAAAPAEAAAAAPPAPDTQHTGVSAAVASSNGTAATGGAAAAVLVQQASVLPPPWQVEGEAGGVAGGYNSNESSIHSSEATSSSNGSTHDLPYVQGGWYSPPSSSSNSRHERHAANGAVPLSRGNGNGSGPRRQQQEYYGGAGSAAAAAALAADVARSMDYKEAQPQAVVAVYEALCDGRDLDGALAVIKECIKASRTDVLARLKHYRFLRPAANRKAVKQAMRFVQLLPRQYADSRTYNMLLRVCAEAGDLRNALHVADMLQAAGLKMDGILYTTLISTCAAAGDAEKAFQLYGQMRADGVFADKMVYASVVKACAQQIDRLPHLERRQQLVLLERAFNLVEDMKGAKIPTDAAVYNALVTAAGRAGQLQRAFNVLEDMLHHGTRPNDRTYASLIDACARAGDKELALRIYRKAQREGCARTLMVYSAAVHACIQAREGCDSEAVMNIYGDMQRNHVAPDNQLFGMLMRAAGASGNLQLVLGLHEEMQREGLRPCRGTESALMAVHIKNGQVAEAQQVYRSLRAGGKWPHAYAMNALLNAYAKNFRLGDVVSLVCDMAEGEMRPDGFTFSAIFNACQRADEAELALDVARLMKLRGVRMDEMHAVILLRICYNRLRQSWVPGGYPPHRSGSGTGSSTVPIGRNSQLRHTLLEALTPRGRQVELREQPDVAWVAQAFGIYREAVAAGVKPSMRMLNRMLMCLRVAWEGKETSGSSGAPVVGSPEALLPHHLPAPLGTGTNAAPVPRQEKIGVESVYHVQAVSILEEAIISNVVPSFKTDSTEPIDLRGMPPAVAEVYVLTVLSAMQRLCDARRVITQNIVFLVPPFDGSKVFLPSHLSHVDCEQITPSTPSQRHTPAYDSDDESEGVSFRDADEAFARASAAADSAGAGSSGDAASGEGDQRTGLGVAGVLRRLRLWAREYGDRGFILLEAKEITRWCKAMARAVDRRSASALAVQKPYGQAGPGRSSLQQQQRQIRMGF